MDLDRKPGSRDGGKPIVKHRVNKAGLSHRGMEHKHPELMITYTRANNGPDVDEHGMRSGVKYSANKHKRWEVVPEVIAAKDVSRGVAVEVNHGLAYEKRRNPDKIQAQVKCNDKLMAKEQARAEQAPPTYADIVRSSRKGPVVRTNVRQKANNNSNSTPPAPITHKYVVVQEPVRMVVERGMSLLTVLLLVDTETTSTMCQQ
jgi:hypothetical protein